MSSLIQALGLDVRILLAQFVNFGVLVFVLWRFAYRPILNLLEERRKKVEQGVKDAEAATEKLEKSIGEGEKIISDSHQEAKLIINEAQTKAEKRYQEIMNQAKEDVKVQMAKEKEKLNQERQALVGQAKTELSQLLILSLEKFLNERMDKEIDKKAIDKIIKDLH